MKENFESDLLEMEIPTQTTFKNIKIEKEKEPLKMGNNCGELCPDNDADHRGACYLDPGHIGHSRHKCSVDGKEWG